MATRISRKFKDISLSFVRNPVTSDILAITDADAIKKSVINLVRTRLGERFFNPVLGSEVENSMFELQTPEMAYSLELNIKTLLKNFEQRIRLSSVLVTYPEDSNEINVRISYDVVGLALPTQTVDFILQPTRV
jgi:phage baseplate assembly protein W